tara:strand:- start:32 stop:433 length:402 start_codon:yes stop_codon:yes gene_type:complete
MKFLIFLPFYILTFVSPLNSETKRKNEYDKYDFYSKCLDDALPRKMNNGLVWECSTKALKELDSLIQKQITSKGDCDEDGFESHACQLKRSQTAFKTYYQTECTWNKYGLHYPYCEMMLKKDRLKWLDKTLGT